MTSALTMTLLNTLDRLAVLEGLSTQQIAARCILSGRVPAQPAFSAEVVAAYASLEADQVRGAPARAVQVATREPTMNRAMTSIRTFSSVPLALKMIDLLSERVLEVLDTFGVSERLVDFPCCDGTEPAYATPYGFNPLEIVIFTAVPVRAMQAVLAALLELQPDLECVVCASSPGNLAPVSIRAPALRHASLTA